MSSVWGYWQSWLSLSSPKSYCFSYFLAMHSLAQLRQYCDGGSQKRKCSLPNSRPKVVSWLTLLTLNVPVLTPIRLELYGYQPVWRSPMSAPMATRALTAWVFMCLGILTLLPVAGHSAAASQPPCGPTDETEQQQAVLRAELLDYSRLENRLVATGNVSLVYGTMSLFADRVELNPESGIGIALGHVRLHTP